MAPLRIHLLTKKFYKVKEIVNIFKIDFDTKRIFGLDILRAAAILIVVVGHGSSLISSSVEKTVLNILPDGVTIFFVLSGFLIGGIIINILETKKAEVTTLINFWLRRWLRTLPMYYFILLLLVALSYFYKDNFDVSDTVPFFFFCQNVFKSELNFFLVSWSLCVEEWFYLLIPAMLFFISYAFKIKPKYAVIFTGVAVIIITIIYRYHRYVTIEVTNTDIFGSMFRGAVITRLDGLMFGLAGAWASYYYKPLWIKSKNWLFAVAIIFHIFLRITAVYLFNTSAFYFCNLSFVLDALATLALLPFLSEVKSAKGFVYKSITYISLISYSIYLIHAQIVQDWLLRFNYIPFWGDAFIVEIKFFLFWMLTITISILTYKFIEVPFMKYRLAPADKERVFSKAV